MPTELNRVYSVYGVDIIIEVSMRRLPVPTDPRYIRATITSAEMDALVALANEAKMSVTSFVRVLAVAAASNPLPKVWERVAATLMASGGPDRKLPGRPRKKDAA